MGEGVGGVGELEDLGMGVGGLVVREFVEVLVLG